ncbi:MAG: VWA domain-containing protein [Dehalococcoidales bacterium]|nr:MAG: VWA domain-containing protein [Dehalococcoidales bacterium]
MERTGSVKYLLLVLIIFLSLFTFFPAACGAVNSANTLVLAYDSWTGTYLPVYVLKTIFENELGYTVKVTSPTSIDEAFEGVANGKADIFTDGWFPFRDTTLERYQNLIKLGQIYGGKERDAFEGLMISNDLARKYNVNHLRDLDNSEIARVLDTDGDGKGNIIGCPNVWGAAKIIPDILSEFGLSKMYEVDQPKSEEDLLSKIEQRLRLGEPTLFYFYQPAAFPEDLSLTDKARWLEGTEAYLNLAFVGNVVRGDFIVNHPEAAKILSKYKISGEDIGWSMGRIARDGDSSKVLNEIAQTWIDHNQFEVNSWLDEIPRAEERPNTLLSETLTVAYSPDKEDIFLKLAIDFNLFRAPNTLPIEPIRREIPDMVDDAEKGNYAAISPDSSIWLEKIDVPVSKHTTFALSPIVIAMRESQAAMLGYPGKPLGWHDLVQSTSANPEFKWCHSSVTTASGLLTLTAECYAGASKQTGLTAEDLQNPAVLEYVKTVESTVQKYGGESEDKVVMRMLAEGSLPLDAFVVQERWVIFFNCNSEEERLVAIYPDDGTFYMDHTLALLDGNWVTDNQKSAYQKFEDFVMDSQQQFMMLANGYRPADRTLTLDQEGSLIIPEYRVNATQPKSILSTPSASVVAQIRELWQLFKKPANIYLVVDTSGSMSGEKLSGAKEALESFIDQIEGDQDQVGIISFSDTVRTVQPLGSLNKQQLKASIAGLRASGGTKLYDAIADAHGKLMVEADTERINVIVAMTDGISEGNIAILDSKLFRAEFPVLIFTVAYGEDADLDVLKKIARMGEGQAYPSDPDTIEKLYELLSAFF